MMLSEATPKPFVLNFGEALPPEEYDMCYRSYHEKDSFKDLAEAMKNFNKDTDILVLSKSYMQKAGLKEQYFKERGISVIAMQGSSLLKPSVVKTNSITRC